MKKYIITLSTMLIISSGICSAMSTQQVKDEYKATIDYAFFKNGDMEQVKQTFYKFAVGTAAMNACYKALTNIKNFVSDHSKNVIGTKDPLLNNAAEQLRSIMTSTINAINEVYANKKLDTEVYFMQLEKECYDLRLKLGKEKFTITEKKEAQDVLMFALDILIVLIRTAREGSEIARRA